MFGDIEITGLLKQNKSYYDIISENNVTLIVLEVEAEGHYSGAEYEEHLVMTVDDFKKYVIERGLSFHEHRDDIDYDPDELYGVKVTISELDGKYSETDADAVMYMYTDDDIMNDKNIKDYIEADNDSLSDWLFQDMSLTETCENLETMHNNVREYIKKFEADMQTVVKITVQNKRKELVKQFKELIDKLSDNQTIKMEIVDK